MCPNYVTTVLCPRVGRGEGSIVLGGEIGQWEGGGVLRGSQIIRQNGTGGLMDGFSTRAMCPARLQRVI